MNRKLKYILAISLMVAIATPAFNVYYLYPKLSNVMISISTDEALEVTGHISTWVFPNKKLNISDSIKAKLIEHKENFNLMKIKVYSSDGTTVFSTSPVDEGSFFGHDYFESRVKKGEVVTNLVKAKEVSLEGEIFNTDVVEVYVPVMEGRNFVGAFETYYDISENFSRVNTIIKTSSVIVVTAMGLFFLIVFTLTSRIDKTVSMLVKAEVKAEKASRAKGDFLAHMSHEIRTPMNAIIGLADILRSDGLNKDQREELNMLRFSANNLLNIINDVLDISKIEAGMLELNYELIHLRVILKELLKSLSVISGEKGIEFTLEISPEVPEFIIGDPTRLTQIINNLLMNAIKFTHEGSVKLSVSACKKSCEGYCIDFSIIDTGIGISREDHEKIFNAFTQADSGNSRSFGGTGLGLNITSRLAEMMGGSLEVISEEGSGSTFRFSACFNIPDEADMAEINSEQGIELQAARNPKSLSILLAEDNVINQKVATKILTNAGHRVEVAGNGQEAIDMVKQGSFDLILMDIEMPVITGYEATRKIKELGDKNAKIPIIAMTAHAFETDCKHCLDIGMNSYLSKPINAKGLLDRINQIALQALS